MKYQIDMTSIGRIMAALDVKQAIAALTDPNRADDLAAVKVRLRRQIGDVDSGDVQIDIGPRDYDEILRSLDYLETVTRLSLDSADELHALRKRLETSTYLTAEAPKDRCWVCRDEADTTHRGVNLCARSSCNLLLTVVVDYYDLYSGALRGEEVQLTKHNIEGALRLVGQTLPPTFDPNDPEDADG